jgi:hypothetical protein
MSHKERVAASLEQITSLCFQISGLVVEEEEEKAVSTFPTCISSYLFSITCNIYKNTLLHYCFRHRFICFCLVVLGPRNPWTCVLVTQFLDLSIVASLCFPD